MTLLQKQNDLLNDCCVVRHKSVTDWQAEVIFHALNPGTFYCYLTIIRLGQERGADNIKRPVTGDHTEIKICTSKAF